MGYYGGLIVPHLPDEYDIRVLPQNAPQGVQKVRPVLSFTATWFTSLSSYSMGSSMVMMFIRSLLMLDSIEYRVEVLPLPVGPVTRTTPCGRSIMLFTLARSPGRNPAAPRSSMEDFGSRTLMTTVSPYWVGRVETL